MEISQLRFSEDTVYET